MYTVFLDDLQRFERLGIGLYNFHPGSAVEGTTKAQAITAIAHQINLTPKKKLCLHRVGEHGGTRQCCWQYL
jgi:AP endonuclease-1